MLRTLSRALPKIPLPPQRMNDLLARLFKRVLSLILLAFIGCSCSERTDKQPREPETGGALNATENTTTQAEVRVPTAAEVQALLVLQDRIVQQPQEVALRRELGQRAIVVNAGVVWSAGRAKIPVNAASPNVAQSQAVLLARIDASRWAAYLLEWHKNDYATAFGSVHANVPGGEVVNQIFTDSTCVVLLKTKLQ